MEKRIVITGIGSLTRHGSSSEEIWEKIKKGESAVTKLNIKHPQVKCQVGAPIDNFRVNEDILSKKEQRRTDTSIHWGLHTCNQAIINSKLDMTKEDPFRIGTIVGSGFGGIMSLINVNQDYVEKGKRLVNFPAYSLTMSLHNMLSGYISIQNKFKGVSKTIATACSSSNHAIESSIQYIKDGSHDIIFCSGIESTVSEMGILSFQVLRALSTSFNKEPSKASRPFSKSRDGFVMGEGSITLVIEEYEHAKARGANILAEIVGTASTSDAEGLTSPKNDGESIEYCIKKALDNAGLKPNDIDYINAHATSTPLGDMVEYRVLKRIFKDSSAVIGATKSITGHLLGAAGALEAMISIFAMRDGIIPKNLNTEDMEDEIAEKVIPIEPIRKEINYVLSNSFGFGGTNSVIILKRFEE